MLEITCLNCQQIVKCDTLHHTCPNDKCGVKWQVLDGDPKFIVTGYAPGINPLKLNQLLDELETEDFLSKNSK